MSKPYPIIHLPNVADQEKLIRGLYRMGYRTGSTRRSWTEDGTWTHWIEASTSHWPYIYLYGNMLISRTTVREGLPTCALLNSVNQFLAYTRRHHAPKPAPAPFVHELIDLDGVPMGFQ